MFGGGNGENPFGKLFGGGDRQPGTQPRPQAPKAPKAFMGIRIDPSTGTVPGIVVQEVQAGGPAAKAGLKGGDVIISINGEKTLDMASLRRVMGAKEPGQTITVKVKRSVFLDTVLVEKQLDLRLTLGSR
jgi:S1-C subfamily serine protease